MFSDTSADIRYEVDVPGPTTLEIGPEKSALPARKIPDAGTVTATHLVHVVPPASSRRRSYAYGILQRHPGRGRHRQLPSPHGRQARERHAGAVRGLRRQPLRSLHARRHREGHPDHAGSDFLAQHGRTSWPTAAPPPTGSPSSRSRRRSCAKSRCSWPSATTSSPTTPPARASRVTSASPIRAARPSSTAPARVGRRAPGSSSSTACRTGRIGRRARLARSVSSKQRRPAEPGPRVCRIVVVHHSRWSSGPHGPNPRLVAAHVPELLAAHHVDLVLSGHDHIYERGVSDSIKYVISGGAGAPLYKVSSTPPPTTRRAESTYNYVDMVVTRFDVTLEAHRIDGSLIEKCGFPKNGAWDCDVGAIPHAIVGPPPGSARRRSAASPSCLHRRASPRARRRRPRPGRPRRGRTAASWLPALRPTAARRSP